MSVARAIRRAAVRRRPSKRDDPLADPQVRAKLYAASPLLFASETLTGDVRPPYNGRFVVGDHHVEWDELVMRHHKLCLMAARDHGKCGVGSDLIPTPSGARVRLSDWGGGHVIAYDLKTHQFVPAYAPPSERNGVHRTLRVTTRSGREAIVTENHPFRMLERWVTAEDLVAGDRIAVPYRLELGGKEDVEDAWLVGLLVGDGGLTSSGVLLTTADEDVIAAVGDMGVDYTYEERYVYYLRMVMPRMRELGLAGKTSHEKRVPDVIFESDDDSIAEFLAGYLDADAHVNFHGGGSVEYYSVSEELMRDVQHLLVRLGVLAVLSPKKGTYLGDEHWSWRLTIRGKDILTLASWLSPRGERGRQLKELAQVQESKGVASGRCVDLFPREVWKYLRHSGHWISQQSDVRVARQYEPTRQKLEKVALVDGNTWLLNLARSDVFWDEIVEVDYAGERETWSIHVPGYENYVANDIVNHNSAFLSYGVPIWRSIVWAGQLGYMFAASQPKANENLDKIRQEVETNPKLAWLVPGRKKKWSATCLRFSNGSQINAAGWQTRVRGGHPFWANCDDVLNDETMYSETTRRKQIDYFYSVIENMVVPEGFTHVIGCVTEDTWVVTGSGLRRIGELNPGKREPGQLYPLNLGVEGIPGIQEAEKFWVQGECPTKRITLEAGFRLEGSHRHPLFVMGEDGEPGWRRSDQILVGDYVAIKVGTERWGKAPLTGYWPRPKENRLSIPRTVIPDLAYLIGLWTAEGSYETTGRVTVSNTEVEIREWLQSSPFGMHFRSYQDGHTLQCSARGFLDVLENLGAKLGTASHKAVPTAIMSGTRENAVEFLRGLFDGDGNVYVKGHTQQVTFATVSESLARDTQTLLLNLGIVSSLSVRPPAKPTKRAPGGGRYPLWILRMTGSEAYRYMTIVGFRLTRKQAAVADMNPDAVCAFRGIPYQGAHVARARRECPGGGGVPNHPAMNLGQIARTQRPRRETLARAVEWIEKCGGTGSGTAAIQRNLAQPNLAWLKVRRVEDSSAFTVDFVIDGDHSFVTNGIVSHNTPFHRQDLLYWSLRENPEYVHRVFPALRGPRKDRPLWPLRYSLELLMRKKASIGPIRFSREFMIEPIASDISLFPDYLFVGEPTEQRAMRLGAPLKVWRELGVTIFMGVDLAMSAEIGGDFFVIFVAGVDGRGNRWIVDIVRRHGIGFQEQLSLINTYGRRYDAALIWIEANQLQRVWGDELIRTTDLPIGKFVTTAQKHTLDHGLPSLRILLENGKYRIPRGDRRSVELTDLWKDEMQSHTWVDGKVECVSGHDDVAMACYICDQAIRAGRFTFSDGAEEDDDEVEALVREMMGELPEQENEEHTAIEVADGQQAANLIDEDLMPEGKTLGELMAAYGRGGMGGFGY